MRKRLLILSLCHELLQCLILVSKNIFIGVFTCDLRPRPPPPRAAEPCIRLPGGGRCSRGPSDSTDPQPTAPPAVFISGPEPETRTAALMPLCPTHFQQVPVQVPWHLSHQRPPSPALSCGAALPGSGPAPPVRPPHWDEGQGL